MSRPLVKVLRLPRNFGVKETLVLEEALLRHDPSNSNWLIQVLVAMLSVYHDVLPSPSTFGHDALTTPRALQHHRGRRYCLSISR